MIQFINNQNGYPQVHILLSSFGHWDFGYYLMISLPVRSCFGEGRCLKFGYFPD